MASELVKVVRCDVCGALDATEYGSVRAASAPRDIDLCGTHDGPVLALEALLEAHGRVQRDANRHAVSRNSELSASRGLAEQFRTCPKCRTVAATRQALSIHASKHHDTPLSELERGLGVEYTCPAGDFSSPSYASVTAHSRREGHPLTGGR